MSFISICILAASSSYLSDWSDWCFWVFLAALLAFYYAFNNWSAKRRLRALAQLTPSMGFLWLDTMPETPRGIAFLRTGLGGELSNAMTGSGASCEVTLFDFEYETGLTARTERTHAQTIAAFRSAHSVLPLGLAGIGLWIVLILKAYQGRIFKLPIIGNLAEKRANNA